MNYLYNGVELPALPEWDKSKYPYAYIVTDPDGTWVLLRVCNARTVIRYKERGPYYILPFGENKGFDWHYTSGYGWHIPQAGLEITEEELNNPNGKEFTDSGNVGQMIEQYGELLKVMQWSNFNILNEADGTIYLAASEPVPVHHRNPSAMLLGFQVGRAIRRMRK